MINDKDLVQPKLKICPPKQNEKKKLTLLTIYKEHSDQLRVLSYFPKGGHSVNNQLIIICIGESKGTDHLLHS